MEAQGVEQLLIDGCKALKRVAGVKLIVGIVGPLHAAIEKVARIRVLAEIGQFRIAPVHGEIGGRGGGAAQDQPIAKARETKKVKNIRFRTVGDATERVGQFMKRNANQ